MAEEKKPVRVIPLKHPVQFGQETIAELVIENRPKAKHFRDVPAQNQTMGDMLRILSKVTGRPQSMIDELDTEDMIACAEVIGDFLPGSLMTGESH